MNNAIAVKISHVIEPYGEPKHDEAFWSPFIAAFEKNESRETTPSTEVYESRLKINLARNIKNFFVIYFAI